MLTNIAVGLSEVRVSLAKDEILVAYSLGSCVGLVLWDPVVKAGGMAHVVLPSSGRTIISRGNPGMPDGEVAWVPGKYADTAVPHMVQRLRALGCRADRLRTWVAGGAHVLKGLMWPAGDIGAANVKGVLDAMEKLGLPPPSADVGEDYGRTMKLYVQEGRVTVSSVGRGERDI